MGKLKQIKEDVENTRSIPQQLINEIPDVIKNNIKNYKPYNFNLKTIMSEYHSDNRKLVTSGAYVPIPFILMMLPIFSGGRSTDKREINKRTLDITGSKSGTFTVSGENLSSDLCLYVFSFLMQMSIYHRTTLLHVDIKYLMEFLGWAKNNRNINKLKGILEKISSVEFGGSYGGLFKADNKKEERYNIFSGRLINSYYFDDEHDGIIINISESILKLFALDKVWYGLNLDDYSKIPTGHCKTLFLYLGAKSRGNNEIIVSMSELFDRLCLNSIKTEKQKNKIVKESLDILKSLKIIVNHEAEGHFIKNKQLKITLFGKRNKKNIFDLSHLSGKSFNSLSCHSYHSNTDISVHTKTIHSKILRIFNFENFIDEHIIKTDKKNTNKENYGFIKNIFDNDHILIQKELSKVAARDNIRKWLTNGETNFEDVNKQFVFKKHKKKINNNILNIIDDNKGNIYQELLTEARDYLNGQKENFNNQEKLVSNLLIRQNETVASLVEELKYKMDSFNIDSDDKKSIYLVLSNYLENISCGLVDDLKESKIPFKIYSDGTLKIKTINENNFKDIKFDVNVTDLIKMKKEKKIDFLNSLREHNKISDYDYNRKLNSNKTYLNYIDNMDGKELVEGHKAFWWQDKIDNKEDRISRYSTYENKNYNESLAKYRINDSEHHKSMISLIIQNEKSAKIKKDLPDIYNGFLKKYDNKIVLLKKIPVYEGDREVKFYNKNSFDDYFKNNTLKISVINKKGNSIICLVKSDVGDENIISDYIIDDFSSEINLDNYQNEYKSINKIADLRSNENIENVLNLPKFTLEESKTIEKIDKIRLLHIENIDSELIWEGKGSPKDTVTIDMEEFFDTDNILNSIEFDNIPDRI